jgi:Na+/H+ antiporter NhaD/arsenite permease-like protein
MSMDTCIAHIATGILVSSNPTNLLLVNAFEIRFVSFAKNMVVPVIATTILLFPFLLYVVFCDETLTPKTMISRVHYLPDKIQNKKPANPNIPIVRERPADDEYSWFHTRDAELERILNPFLDRNSALLGSIIFMATTILLLVLNAVYLSQGGNTDFWATLPVAVLVLCWDLSMG